jgi:hypothetical protein
MEIVHNVVCCDCGGAVDDALLLDESEWTNKPLCAACLRDIIHYCLEHIGRKPSDFSN